MRLIFSCAGLQAGQKIRARQRQLLPEASSPEDESDHQAEQQTKRSVDWRSDTSTKGRFHRSNDARLN